MKSLNVALCRLGDKQPGRDKWVPALWEKMPLTTTTWIMGNMFDFLFSSFFPFFLFSFLIPHRFLMLSSKRRHYARTPADRWKTRLARASVNSLDRREREIIIKIINTPTTHAHSVDVSVAPICRVKQAATIQFLSRLSHDEFTLSPECVVAYLTICSVRLVAGALFYQELWLTLNRRRDFISVFCLKSKKKKERKKKPLRKRGEEES